MRFYDAHCVYYAEDGATQSFDYDEVAQVCHISARYNDYGERIERGSYVLILKDGTQIDLDGSFQYPETRWELVQTLFPETPVTELDSDRDLP